MFYVEKVELIFEIAGFLLKISNFLENLLGDAQLIIEGFVDRKEGEELS